MQIRIMKGRKMKRIHVFRILSILFVLALIGCQSQTNTPESSQPESPADVAEQPEVEVADEETEEPIKLTFWMLGGDAQVAYLEKWIPVFEEQNPGITVEWKILDWTNGPAQVLTAFAGGIGPDVFVTYSNDIPRWVENGAYQPLDNYFNRDDFTDVSVELATWKGNMYAVPWNLKTHTYYVRSDFLNEAGITKVPETWDEMVEASIAMTKYDAAGNVERSGLWIIVNHPYKTISQFQGLLTSAGGWYFSEDGCKSTFNSQAGVEAAQLIDDLLNVHKVDVPGAITTDATDLAQGKVASMFSNLATRGVVQNFPEVVEYLEILPPPSKDGNVGLGQAGGNYMGISPSTKNVDAAVALVEFLVTDPGPLYDYALTEGGAIAYKPAINDDYFEIDPFVERWNNLLENYARGVPKHPNWAEISNEITLALDNIYVNGIDPQVALDEAARNVDQILEQNGCAE